MSAPRGPRRGDGAIVRLLGEHCASGGPFALLQLTPETCDDDTIIAQLDSQLTLIASHPESDTPEADETRLALHAAAAQLLDAKVRAYLIANWQESHPGSSHPPKPPIRKMSSALPAPRPRSKAHVALEHDAILTLGLYGGWNKRSLRRLVSLAHARGMDAAQVARTVNALSSRRRGTASQASSPTASPSARNPQPATTSPTNSSTRSSAESRADPATKQSDSPRAGPDMRVIGMALGIIAITGFVAVVLGLVVMVVNGSDANRNTTLGQTVTSPTSTTPAENTTTSRNIDDVKPSAPDNPGLITLTERASSSPATIARATKALSIDPESAVETFQTAISALQGAWPRIPPDTHVAAQHEIVEFMYRSSANAAISERAFNALAGKISELGSDEAVSPDAPWSATWSAGMLTRLSSETELSGTLRQRVAGELIAALRERRVVQKPTFRAGALAALDGLTDSFSAHVDKSFPWEKWSDAATTLSQSNPKAQEALLLDALQIVLLNGGEPNDDKGTFDAIRLLAQRVPWRSGDESRRRLLSWFLDERLTNADLHALTTTLARESSASGVDVTMVLPLLASTEVRQQLRGRYASVWGMSGGVDRKIVAEELASAARDAMADLPSDALASEYLAQTVRLSRLSEAIAWTWRGRSQEADELLAILEDDLDAPSTSASNENTSALDQRIPADVGSGSSWAARYLAAKQRAAIRLDLLDQLETMPMPDAVAAEVLVREALRGSRAQIRKRAQQVVSRHAADAAVVNAVLEQLPTIPHTRDNGILIESITHTVLPSVSDDDWQFQARRALVEHLLDLLSTNGSYATIDSLVEQLSISYVGRTVGSPLVGPDRERVGSTDAAISASLLYRKWRSGLDRAIASRTSSISADAADRLRTGRLELASGPIQQFAANQASICEVMGIVIAGEQPASGHLIQSVIETMTDERRRAGSAFQQIFAVERAMLELWLIRIGEQTA